MSIPRPVESAVVAPAIPENLPAVARTGDDPVLARLNQVVARLDEAIEDNHVTRQRIDRLEMRLEETADRHQRAIEQLERTMEDRLQTKLGEGVKAAIQPGLAAVESRLERVETIQVESMNALDARFGDLAFQTRLALSAGGLVTLAAVMVVLLR